MPDFELLKKLFLLQVKNKIDCRQVACEIHAEQDGKRVMVSGFSQFPQTDAFIRDTAQQVFAPAEVAFDLRILNKAHRPTFHEVVTTSAPFYKDAVIKKEDLLTEALYGSIVRTYFARDGFIYAQHADGYVGYVPKQHLKKTTVERYLRWKNGECAIARVPLPVNGVVVPPGARLIREGSQVQLTDGEWHKVSSRNVQFVKPDTGDFRKTVLDAAESFKDTPYLWGGKTQFGIDCSGFVQSLALQERILLPRDASMQAHVGEIVGYLPKYADLVGGDLLFFMNDKAHVFHVGIYLGEGMYIHSSGSKNVMQSSLLTGGTNYLSRYGKTFVFARRVHS